MMNGTMVDNTVVGGPAYNSKQMGHGDVVLEVDGREANNENIFELLIGGDLPGSTVDVMLAKGGPTVIHALTFPAKEISYISNDTVTCWQGKVINVKLKRMATSEIQDRRRMFELFSTLKVPCDGTNVKSRKD